MTVLVDELIGSLTETLTGIQAELATPPRPGPSFHVVLDDGSMAVMCDTSQDAAWRGDVPFYRLVLLKATSKALLLEREQAERLAAHWNAMDERPHVHVVDRRDALRARLKHVEELLSTVKASRR